MKNKLYALTAFAVFIAVGATLTLVIGHIFFLLNFAYIGGFLSVGFYLAINRKPYARNVAQIGIGAYMFVLLGIVFRENMQIEGFWFYLFSGVFQAAVIHYCVAKIAGPLLFGRGWCGYACWTAAVLDLLPHKTSPPEKKRKIGLIRYVLFVLSFCFVGSLFLFKADNLDAIMYTAFIAGNALYYIVGITIAFAFRDNRAFCKYICPVTVFLKPMSYFSLVRVKVDETKCVSCGKCEKICPMNVKLTDNRRSRKNGTECILCLECVNNCPKGAVKV